MTRRVLISLTDEQLAAIDAARAPGESRSAYFRRAGLAAVQDSQLTRDQRRAVMAAVKGAIEGL